MRLVVFVLRLVLVGAVVIWVLALAHGFHGAYCFNSTGTCTAQDIRFKGSVVAWLAPMVFIVDLFVLQAIRRASLQ
jgi:hypothetical protein